MELQKVDENVTTIRKTLKGEMLLEFKQSAKQENTAYQQLVEKVLGQEASVKLMTKQTKIKFKDLDGQLKMEKSETSSVLKDPAVSSVTELKEKKLFNLQSCLKNDVGLYHTTSSVLLSQRIITYDNYMKKQNKKVVHAPDDKKHCD
ncbi:hypothetical protein GQX74_011611 [Glossina fuscipes]|nr:hypothetical protein GQX74_011611 [Glossina fuscipes]